MKRTGNRPLLATIAVALAVLVLLPVFWALSTSFKNEVDAVEYPPRFMPQQATVANYLHVFSDVNFVQQLGNSVLYSVGSVVLALAVSVLAGYAASRFEFRGKNALMLVILGTSMVPSVALLVPTYMMLRQLGLLNSVAAIVVISAARLAPQTVWFMKNFIDAVPGDIEEAAMIDGATRPQIVARLVLPLIRPGIAATAVLGLIAVWNDYITVAVFAPELGRRTLQVALVNQVFDAIGISWSYLMAFAIVSCLPVVLIFLASQRWFISGLTAGSVKG
jgi:ABC-type glycerol-3-phosphate transport system permease component